MTYVPRWRRPVFPAGAPRWADGSQSRIERGTRRPIEHLCARDLLIHDGPVDECCADLWRDEGIEP